MLGWLFIALIGGPTFGGLHFHHGRLVDIEVIVCVWPRDFRGEPFSDVSVSRTPLPRLFRVRTDFIEQLRASADLL